MEEEKKFSNEQLVVLLIEHCVSALLSPEIKYDIWLQNMSVLKRTLRKNPKYLKEKDKKFDDFIDEIEQKSGKKDIKWGYKGIYKDMKSLEKATKKSKDEKILKKMREDKLMQKLIEEEIKKEK